MISDRLNIPDHLALVTLKEEMLRAANTVGATCIFADLTTGKVRTETGEGWKLTRDKPGKAEP